MMVALCHPYVIPARGGCETYIIDLARRLLTDRHEVHLFAWGWDSQAVPPEVRCHPLPRPPRVTRARRPWAFSAACRRALAAERFDVSLGFDKTFGQDILYPQGGLHQACARQNRLVPRPTLGRARAALGQWLSPAFWSFRRLEGQQYLRRKSTIVVNSEMVRGHFRRFYPAAAGRVRVVRSAIDPRRFPVGERSRWREEARRSWGVAPGEVVGLFAAMNYELKGLTPLLHAVRRLPREGPFRLVVAGNQRFRRFQRLARRLDVSDRVRFIGHQPDMHSCYSAADFLVHPTFYDPCSLVVLEALACGLPVVTSRFNGAAEMLGAGAGFVIGDPHDHLALAECMRMMLVPDIRRRCAAAAADAAAQWTFEDHYRELFTLMREVVRTKYETAHRDSCRRFAA